MKMVVRVSSRMRRKSTFQMCGDYNAFLLLCGGHREWWSRAPNPGFLLRCCFLPCWESCNAMDTTWASYIHSMNSAHQASSSPSKTKLRGGVIVPGLRHMPCLRPTLLQSLATNDFWASLLAVLALHTSRQAPLKKK